MFDVVIIFTAQIAYKGASLKLFSNMGIVISLNRI
jgi:hypothetical protein